MQRVVIRKGRDYLQATSLQLLKSFSTTVPCISQIQSNQHICELELRHWTERGRGSKTSNAQSQTPPPSYQHRDSPASNVFVTVDGRSTKQTHGARSKLILIIILSKNSQCSAIVCQNQVVYKHNIVNYVLINN